MYSQFLRFFFFMIFVAGCSSFSEHLPARKITVKLSFSGKPLANSAAIVFPEGFDQSRKDNNVPFFMLEASEDGSISFEAPGNLFQVVVGTKYMVASGIIHRDGEKWSAQLKKDDAGTLSEATLKSIARQHVLVCHYSWCRWKFCQYCCEYSGNTQCIHLFKPGWKKEL